MDYLSTFKSLDQHRPFLDNTQYDPAVCQPQYVPPQDNASMEQTYAMFQTTPPLYNIDGYISPYPMNNWDMSSTIMNFVHDDSRLPPLEQKLDPNKIFSSDIAALRTLASDQSRITKMFERRLVESLTDRGKFGLTEDDIAAMQALTSARAAITAINKEQIAIKKNIADLKIKQGQTGGVVSDGMTTISGRGTSSMDIGSSIMDNLFKMPVGQTPQVSTYQAEEASLDRAAQVIDSVLPNAVSIETQYESLKPTINLIVGDTDDDYEFAAFTADGQRLDDYPLPNVEIANIDRDVDDAVDKMSVHYPVRYRKDLV